MGLFIKPNVEPPPGLPDPEFDAFNDLIKKYQNEYEINLFADNLSDVVRIKEAMDDVFDIEFTGIRNFLRSTKTSDQMAEIARFRNMFTSIATSASWMIGRESASKDALLKTRLEHKRNIDIDDVPNDAMMLLTKAVYLPYWLFASVMSDFYDSRYGARNRYQKEAHLKSTYQSFMKGVLMCFLAGVKYDTKNDNKNSLHTEKVKNGSKISPGEKETNWPVITAGIIAVLAGLIVEIGMGEFIPIRTLFTILGAFIRWWPGLALLQIIIVKVRRRNLHSALGNGIRSNYLLLIALLIAINIMDYRFLQSYNISDAVFGGVYTGAFYYIILYGTRWIFRKIIIKNLSNSRILSGKTGRYSFFFPKDR